MCFFEIVDRPQGDVDLVFEYLVIERHIVPGVEGVGGLNGLRILPQAEVSAYEKFSAEFIAGVEVEIATEAAIGLGRVGIIFYGAVAQGAIDEYTPFGRNLSTEIKVEAGLKFFANIETGCFCDARLRIKSCILQYFIATVAALYINAGKCGPFRITQLCRKGMGDLRTQVGVAIRNIE